MIDLRYIREDVEVVKDALKKRDVVVDLDGLLELDKRKRDILQEIETRRATRNENSKSVGELMKKIGILKKDGNPSEDLEKKAGEIKEATSKIGEEITELEGHLRPLEAEIESLLLTIPNIPDIDTPIGPDETYNQEIRKWGDIPKFEFDPKPHWELGEDLGILDFERAVKIAKSRFSLYMGAGARLERALINLMLDVHTRENGYTEVFPPILVNAESLRGTGQLPKLEEDMFKCEEDGLYLIPTAEVSVTNIYRDEILDGDDLPIKYAAYTPCFRREAGAHGRETRGLIRQHQFNKVELVKFVRPKESAAEHESLTENAEDILKLLGLAYRVVILATGDLSFAATKCYDLEVWMPSANGYKEISSCSNFSDFQARRANIRFRPKKGDKPEFLHTINGSGLAIGRTVAAIMENYQQRDGSIKVPDALVDYMGYDIIKGD